jgi:hypothetical protein
MPGAPFSIACAHATRSMIPSRTTSDDDTARHALIADALAVSAAVRSHLPDNDVAALLVELVLSSCTYCSALDRLNRLEES